MDKNLSFCPAVILNDEVISDNPEGGTGKGLLMSALSKMKKLVVIDGKSFAFERSFAYQLVSADTGTNAGITDASVFLYPVDGYGDPDFIRQLIEIEKPDALMLITDPRYFEWLFMIENEVRKHCPIIYLNIWDDYPAPLYNKAFYESCDALLAISKQTKLINELVLGDKAKSKIIEYVPHGLNENHFYPIEKEDELKELEKYKQQLFANNEKDFVVFFNSRNIRRKQIPDTMLAFRFFLDTLPKEKAEKCALVLHTEVISEHGTDLEAVRKILFTDYPNAIYFCNN